MLIFLAAVTGAGLISSNFRLIPLDGLLPFFSPGDLLLLGHIPSHGLLHKSVFVLEFFFDGAALAEHFSTLCGSSYGDVVAKFPLAIAAARN